MRILILGVNGMIGHVLFNYLSSNSNYKTYGTVRLNNESENLFKNKNNVFTISMKKDAEFIRLIDKISPNLIINCLGIVKQNLSDHNYLSTIYINSLLPHRIAKICSKFFIRLINFSTDCVFSGVRGNYTEDDIPDPIDFYGRTKLVGEVNYGNVLTIRTSFIGHQINSKYGLLEWFLTQKDNCKGFVNAIYSGLPTIEIAKILNDHIIFNKKLIGLYQISGNAINKYELLSLINKIYGLKLNIEKEHKFKIDRTLNSKKFRDATGYKPPNWESLIKKMYKYRGFSNV